MAKNYLLRIHVQKGWTIYRYSMSGNRMDYQKAYKCCLRKGIPTKKINEFISSFPIKDVDASSVPELEIDKDTGTYFFKD